MYHSVTFKALPLRGIQRLIVNVTITWGIFPERWTHKSMQWDPWGCGFAAWHTCVVCLWTCRVPPGRGVALSPGTVGWSQTRSLAAPACGWCRTDASAGPPSAPAKSCEGHKHTPGIRHSWCSILQGYTSCYIICIYCIFYDTWSINKI